MSRVLKESEYFVTWLLLSLGNLIGGFLVGAIGGAIAGAFLGAAGVDLSTIKFICGGIGFVLGTVLSYVLFRWLVAVLIVHKVVCRVENRFQQSPNWPVQAPR